jgi:transcriptional regulator with XRE-family HTH domain
LSSSPRGRYGELPGDASRAQREPRVDAGPAAELIDVSPRVYNRWETSAAAPRLDTLVKIADILNVTLDELVGRTEPTSEVVIQNPRLHALYREINRLSDEDQQALVILLDSLVKRSRMDKVLAG